MKKISYILPVLALITLVACSEKNEASEYDNWGARNQHYVDSIAALALSNTDGWRRYVVYDHVSTEESPDKNVNHYVYVKTLSEGTSTRNPEQNDSIRIHYLGRLIPTDSHPQGYIFGKSYHGYALDETIDVPTLLAVTENVKGIATATMHMVEGDYWKVVVPASLGYGTGSRTGIPGSSTLIFEVKLARIYKYMIDTDTTWH